MLFLIADINGVQTTTHTRQQQSTNIFPALPAASSARSEVSTSINEPKISSNFSSKQSTGAQSPAPHSTTLYSAHSSVLLRSKVSSSSTSPTQSSTTPAQNSTTLVQSSTTPAQNSTTPVQNSTTPAQNSTTPVQSSTTAMKTDPNRDVASPGVGIGKANRRLILIGAGAGSCLIFLVVATASTIVMLRLRYAAKKGRVDNVKYLTHRHLRPNLIVQ